MLEKQVVVYAAFVVFEVPNDDKRNADPLVYVLCRADLVQQRPLFSGCKLMKKQVAFRVLIEDLSKFLRHGQAVFTRVPF